MLLENPVAFVVIMIVDQPISHQQRRASMIVKIRPLVEAPKDHGNIFGLLLEAEQRIYLVSASLFQLDLDSEDLEVWLASLKCRWHRRKVRVSLG